MIGSLDPPVHGVDMVPVEQAIRAARNGIVFVGAVTCLNRIVVDRCGARFNIEQLAVRRQADLEPQRHAHEVLRKTFRAELPLEGGVVIASTFSFRLRFWSIRDPGVHRSVCPPPMIGIWLHSYVALRTGELSSFQCA